MPTINVEPGFGQGLQDIADILAKARKVVVITGAGISTNCGIPDFRSENGLYSLIQAQYEAMAGIMPVSDGIDYRPVKRRKINCLAASIPTKTMENRCDQQLPSRHSHFGLNSTTLPMAENIVQEHKPKLSQVVEQSSLAGVIQEPSNPQQVSASYPVKDTASTSTAPEEGFILQRKLRSSRSVQGANRGKFGVDLFNINPSSEESAPVSVSSASNHHRRLRSSKNTRSGREGEIASRRSLRSSVASDIKKGPLSLENCVEDNSKSLRKSTTSISEKDTSSIEVIVPKTSEQPFESDLETAPYMRVDVDEFVSLQTPTILTSIKYLPNLKGKDLFDSAIWTDPLTTSIFYTFISSLRQKILSEIKGTTPTHKFIRALRDGGRLVRNYTQNIDLLEAREGLCTDLARGPGSRTRFASKNQKEAPPTTVPGRGAHDRGVEVVHLHGKLDGLRCGLCTRSVDWDEDNRYQATLAGKAPECPWCRETNAHREGKGRRSLSIGRLRPDIVLYGEEHPSAHLVGPIVTHDLSLGPDVLLILGTSLRVHGLKFMVREFAKAVHRKCGKVIFVNKTKPPESIWADVIDYWVEWDCDAWVGDLQERRKDIWLPRGTITKGSFQEEKPKPIPKKPMATRIDVANGAHLTLKIIERLGRLSGRLPAFGKLCNEHQKSIHKILIEEKDRERREPPALKKASVKLNKENGAYLVFEIITNLRRLSGNSMQLQTIGRRNPMRVPLASKCANLPSQQSGTKRTTTTLESPSQYCPQNTSK